MEAYVLDWLNLLGRWVHMVTGIAWIGASLYFVWLDNHLQAPKHSTDVDKGVGGEIWSVHGGGFYHAQKYTVAPPELPDMLHWFKWEAYSTWLSGMFLMVLIYWYGAEIYLIDPTIAELSKPMAIFIGVAVIVSGWVVYDRLCHSPLGRNESLLSGVLFILLVATAFGLCQLFSGRGAFIHYGAILGTIMVANVFFVIIPGQKDLVRAKEEGRAPDPIHGIRGKQRSVHNTYFTLPVLFVMVSNHYASTYGHEHNWAILVVLTLIGALIRVYFVARHKGSAPLMPLVISAVLLIGLMWALAPILPTSSSAAPATVAGAFVSDGESLGVVKRRCASCHAAKPIQPGFAAAPKGVVLESLADLNKHATAIYQQTVVTRVMPIGNLTQMSASERELIGRWYMARP